MHQLNWKQAHVVGSLNQEALLLQAVRLFADFWKWLLTSHISLIAAKSSSWSDCQMTWKERRGANSCCSQRRWERWTVQNNGGAGPVVAFTFGFWSVSGSSCVSHPCLLSSQSSAFNIQQVCLIGGPLLVVLSGVCMFSSRLCGFSRGIQLHPTLQNSSVGLIGDSKLTEWALNRLWSGILKVLLRSKAQKWSE